jgi:hypothetical protein
MSITRKSCKGVFLLLLACSRPQDSERDESEAYAASIAAGVDGGLGRLSLVSRRDIHFGDGFYGAEYDPALGKAWRWARRHAELAVRCPFPGAKLRMSGSFYGVAGEAQSARILHGQTVLYTFPNAATFHDQIVAENLCAKRGERALIVIATEFEGVGAEDPRKLAIEVEAVGWSQ